jgi:site-specific DNA recombinase
VREGLDRLDWTARQHLIRTLVSRVEIDEEKVTVVYRLPPSGREAGPEDPPGSTEGAAVCRLHSRRRGAETQKDEEKVGSVPFFHLFASLRLCDSALNSGSPGSSRLGSTLQKALGGCAIEIVL